MSVPSTKIDLPRYPTAGWIPLPYHIALLDDEVRCQFFDKSMRDVIQSDWATLDLGGGTGILSYLAARHSRKVYTIEQDPRTVRALRRMISENKLSEKITVIEGDAATFVPPEPIQAVVCEMMHVGLLEEPQVRVMNAIHATLRKHYPEVPYRVFPGNSVCSFSAVQYDFYRHDYLARFPHYHSSATKPPRSVSLTHQVPYFIADFQEPVQSTVNAKVSLQITKPGKLNAVCINTLAGFLKNPKNPMAEPPLVWNLLGFIFPLTDAVQTSVGDNVEFQISYETGGPLDGVRIEGQVNGVRVKNLE